MLFNRIIKKMINKNKIIIILSVLIFLQLILIAHRVSFEPNILKNFYKKDTAIKKSIKDKKVYELSQFILNNKIKNFTFSNFRDNEEDSSIKERLISYTYPIQYNKSSKYIISRKKLKVKNCIKKFDYSNLFLYEC